MAGIDKRKAVQAALNYTHQRRFDKAIAEYKNALTADPQDVNVHMKLGDLYAQTGATQEAIATYMRLGDLYRADGLAVKAIAIYKKVVSLDPKNMQIYLACADLYAEQGLVGEAKIQYMTVAEHYTKAGNTQKALEIFEKIANLDPTNFVVAAKVGEMCERERLPDQAVAHYVAAAQAAARTGHPKEAADLYGRALRLKPTAYEPQWGLGKFHFEAGALPEAAAALERAAAAAPDNAAPLLLLGQCYVRLGASDKAEDALRRAVTADATAAEARLELGRIVLASGRIDEACDAFAAVADQFLEEGRGEEALAIFRDLCAEQPRVPLALAKLAEIHQRLGREEEARETECRLAQAWELSGRPDEAAAVYRRFLEANPEDAAAQERLQALSAPSRAPAVEAAAPPAPLETPAVSEELALEEEASPRVIPIAEAPPALAEEAPFLAEGEADLDLLGGAFAEAAPGGDLDGDAAEVAEQLAEADVYLKYGLVEKAVERLRETLNEAPQNLAARARLRKIFSDEGRRAEASAEGLALVEALLRRGQRARALQELEALHREDPEAREIQARLQELRDGSPPAAAPEPRAADPAAVAAPAAAAPQDLDAIDALLTDEGGPPGGETPEAAIVEEPEVPAGWRVVAEAYAVEAVSAAPPAPPEQEQEGLLELSNLLRLTEQEESGPAVPAEAPALDLGVAEPAEKERVFQLDLDPMLDDAGVSLEIPPEPQAAEPEPVQDLRLTQGGIAEELEEAEFFRSQGMAAEAGALYRKILSVDPGNAVAQAGLAAVAKAPAGEEPPPVAIVSPAGPGESPALPEGLTDDTWIPGPDPFALETAGEQELAPPVAAGPAAPVGPGMDLIDLEEHPAGDGGPTVDDPLEMVPLSPPPVSLPAEAGRATPPEAAPVAPWQEEPAARVPQQPPAPAPLAAAPPPPPAPAQKAAAPPSAPRRIGPAEDVPVFRVATPVEEAGPGGFVNLGDEIQEELKGGSTLPATAEGEALLNALLEEFQRGVRENLDAQDYETHYNLGIAYKEMDLFEEAIEAFRLAAQDLPRRLTCADLIALCFLGTGQPARAAEELVGALGLPGYPPEDYYGLRYDLATAYEAAGQEVNALSVLEELVVQAPSFREVKARVAALRQRVGEPAGVPAPRPAHGDGSAARLGAAAPVAEPAPLASARPAPAAPARAAAQPRPAAPDDAPPEVPAPKAARPRRDKVSFV